MSRAREARADDMPALLALEARCFAGDPWSRHMLEEELRRPGGRFFVLEDEGRVVGMAIGWYILDELHVLHVGVDPRERRKGFGRALMDALEGSARDAEVSWLEVRRDNEAAIGLYLGMGYEPVATRPRYYEDGCDATVMRKRLERA